MRNAGHCYEEGYFEKRHNQTRQPSGDFDPYYHPNSYYGGSSREAAFNMFANIANDPDGFEKGFQKAMAKFRALTIEEVKANGFKDYASAGYYKGCIDELAGMVKDLGYKVSVDIYA